MAPAKDQGKGVPPSQSKARTPVKKLTRKEKHAINAAEHRVNNTARHRQRIAIQKELRPEPANRTVVHPDGGSKPTLYTEDIGARICYLFSTDPKFSLLKMNSDPTLPTVWTFYTWLREQPTFDKLYSRAREIQCDLKAAEIEEWCATPLLGTVRVTRSGKDLKGHDIDSEELRESDNVDRARLMVETRKWLLSKERPKKYGIAPIEADQGSGLSELLNQFKARYKEIENEPT
jgi:hypothetical protein